MRTNLVIPPFSAYDSNSLEQIFANNLVRRLARTHPALGKAEEERVINQYSEVYISWWQRHLGFVRYLNQMYLYDKEVLVLLGILLKCIYMTAALQHPLHPCLWHLSSLRFNKKSVNVRQKLESCFLTFSGVN